MCRSGFPCVCTEASESAECCTLSISILIPARKTFIESGANMVASESSNPPVSISDSAGVTDEHNYIWVYGHSRDLNCIPHHLWVVTVPEWVFGDVVFFLESPMLLQGSSVNLLVHCFVWTRGNSMNPLVHCIRLGLIISVLSTLWR